MTALATYIHQPADRLDYDIPFRLSAGDALVEANCVLSVPTGMVIEFLLAEPNRIKLWVEDGATPGNYKVEFTAVTLLGRKKQIEIRFKVRDH